MTRDEIAAKFVEAFPGAVVMSTVDDASGVVTVTVTKAPGVDPVTVSIAPDADVAKAIAGVQ